MQSLAKTELNNFFMQTSSLTKVADFHFIYKIEVFKINFKHKMHNENVIK